MVNTKYLELLHKYFNGKLNIQGIELVLPNAVLLHNPNLFYFPINNPNDISYSKMSLTGFLEEEMNSFYSIMSFEDKNKMKYKFSGPEFYINLNLYNKIKNTLTGITDITLSDIQIDIVHKQIDIDFIEDGCDIKNIVEPIRAWRIFDNKDKEQVDLNWALINYEQLRKTERFLEHETNYLSLDGLFENEEIFIDGGWMYFYCKTVFSY